MHPNEKKQSDISVHLIWFIKVTLLKTNNGKNSSNHPTMWMPSSFQSNSSWRSWENWIFIQKN